MLAQQIQPGSARTGQHPVVVTGSHDFAHSVTMSAAIPMRLMARSAHRDLPVTNENGAESDGHGVVADGGEAWEEKRRERSNRDSEESKLTG